ncbi:hypothetical protein [Hyalangium sp.]|uniref:hypothetical protein n=1 Tax=Hyalangium sp. TaxID=2028555 RepID=UPI002D3DE1E8|nr:hypothetical protein [Hyalangium sp.]HYH99799.1 hypothetical protein [Hyalangium sp.]
MARRGATFIRQLRCHSLFYARDLASGARQLCRSQLVLEFCDTKPNDQTLLLCFMNPGASSPRDPAAVASIPIVTHASQLSALGAWLPTIPDATHAQTVLLMEALDCWRAVVVNLSDVCEVDSNALCTRVDALASNTPRWDSLFHAPRHTELDNLLADGLYVAMIGGWGTLKKQACLRDAAGEVCARFQGIVGAPARSRSQKLGLLHPRPTANGGPKWRYYGLWRQVVASKLNLSQPDQATLKAKRTIDLLVDKDRIWTPIGSDRLTIDLTFADLPEGD